MIDAACIVLRCMTSLFNSTGYGVAVVIGIAISFVIGVCSYYFVQGSPENFFVAGRSLPLWVASITLAAQSIDSNALMGNVDLSYRFSFWDGTYRQNPSSIFLCCWMNIRSQKTLRFFFFVLCL